MFGATGNNVARTFFRISPTGQVYVAVPLTLSRQTQFELQASVYTQGFSENPGLCSVRISVTRNLNPPVFTNTLLRFTVFEYEPIGYQITQLTASDADNDTIRYYLSAMLSFNNTSWLTV